MVHAWHLKSQQGTQKSYAPEFLILAVLKLTSCGLVDLLNMNKVKGTHLKTLKEKLKLLRTIVRCIFPKKILNMDWNMMLTVLMEFAHIRHS